MVQVSKRRRQCYPEIAWLDRVEMNVVHTLGGLTRQTRSIIVVDVMVPGAQQIEDPQIYPPHLIELIAEIGIDQGGRF